jgi:hypothetical protein
MELAHDRIHRIEHRGVDDGHVAGFERRIEGRRGGRPERHDIPVQHDVGMSEARVEQRRCTEGQGHEGAKRSGHTWFTWSPMAPYVRAERARQTAAPSRGRATLASASIEA